MGQILLILSWIFLDFSIGLHVNVPQWRRREVRRFSERISEQNEMNAISDIEDEATFATPIQDDESNDFASSISVQDSPTITEEASITASAVGSEEVIEQEPSVEEPVATTSSEVEPIAGTESQAKSAIEEAAVTNAVKEEEFAVGYVEEEAIAVEDEESPTANVAEALEESAIEEPVFDSVVVEEEAIAIKDDQSRAEDIADEEEVMEESAIDEPVVESIEEEKESIAVEEYESARKVAEVMEESAIDEPVVDSIEEEKESIAVEEDESARNIAEVMEKSAIEEPAVDSIEESVEKEEPLQVNDAEAVNDTMDEEAEKEEEEMIASQILQDFSAGGGRNLEVARLQTLLERSQSRRRQVEAVVAEELAALRAQLENELLSEKERARSVGSLLNELERTLKMKTQNVEREKALLVQLQDVAQRTKESEIKKSIEQAIETKASLVAIELLLIEDIEECATQVAEEGKEMDRRLEAMKKTRDALPAVDDTVALRAFSWSQVEMLEDQLKESALAIAKTDAKVRILRARIADALDQRDAVLNMAPNDKFAVVGSNQQQKKGKILQLNLSELDDEALAEAVRSSAASAFGRISKLGTVTIASLSTFFDSENSKNVQRLLAQASNSTKRLTQSLSSAAKEKPKLLPVSTDIGNNRTDNEEKLVAETVTQLGEISKDLGAAMATAASGLGQASKETGLGQTAADALSAISATFSSASILAFRKIKQSISGSSATSKSENQKTD